MATHTLTIPDWHPTRLNQLLHCHWGTKAKLKRSDRQIVLAYAIDQRIPSAEGPRRVSLLLTLAPRQRAGDPDAYWKSLLDALVCAGLLVDDSRKWVELGPVEFRRGKTRATEIRLEDVGMRKE